MMTEYINTWVYMMIHYNFMQDSLVRFSFRARGIILSSAIVTGKRYMSLTPGFPFKHGWSWIPMC